MNFDKLNEECAVFGLSVNTGEAAGVVYNALLALQHRGQESAGIAISNGHAIKHQKGLGLVSEVFTDTSLPGLPSGDVAIGHVRYSTSGSNIPGNIQPVITEYLTGRIAVAHNGNIVNAKAIRDGLEKLGIDFAATSDTEVISSMIAYNILKTNSLADGLTETAEALSGAFSMVVLTGDAKLLAVRDPYGFRPLCIGKNDSGICIASESCALDSCGFTFVRDVMPGEVLIIENGKITYSERRLKADRTGLCIFEYVYFARPDSIIDNQSVYKARYNMGMALAAEHPVDADVVCGVPDSGNEAAMGFAAGSGIPLVSGFVKNRYIGRSFICPTQQQRDTAVRMKLNPLAATVSGKRVVLVDDSIVRGTTSEKIVGSMRAAGAKEVHMRISSPPFRHPCYFGTDIDSEDKLIANHMSIDDICKKIGADSLGFISCEGLVNACRDCSLGFCTGCFTGDYNIKCDHIPEKNELESK